MGPRFSLRLRASFSLVKEAFTGQEFYVSRDATASVLCVTLYVLGGTLCSLGFGRSILSLFGIHDSVFGAKEKWKLKDEQGE